MIIVKKIHKYALDKNIEIDFSKVMNFIINTLYFWYKYIS